MTPLNDPERILVVDDDDSLRRLLVRLLRSADFACEDVGSVGAAREYLGERHADLVLLDVNLPGESGLGLARELGARPRGPAVIMMSGADDAEVAAIALDAGAYGYITKPFKRNEVTIAVRNGLRRKRIDEESQTYRDLLEQRVVERTVALQQALDGLRVAHEETVLRLSKAVEYRDPETGSHIERMSHYCALLAGRLGLDPDAVRVASRLHDVGKIAVPDSILQKPGPLTPEERTEMERHADTGYRLLRGARSELLEVAATIAWTHHERFDGGGYPRRLAGEDIPLVGRIACVADVFDALTTDRVYRPALPVDEAVATLRAERGRHFDAAIVDTFLEDMDEVLAILARFEGEPSPQANGSEPAAPEVLVTLQEAAAAAGVSASTMRRWADDGRVRAVRTAGGHRRFALETVRKVAGERANRPTVRPVAMPADRLAVLGDHLRVHGAELAARAASALYRGGPQGWLGAAESSEAVREWVGAVASACDSARYADAAEASELVMRRAHLHGASLLERHTFLERFGELAVRSLSHDGAERGELVGTRRLITALQQTLLERR